jgi:hypothetical protein
VETPLGSRYVLHELLGRGAMGQVFRGSVRVSGAMVAVKVLKPELVSDAKVVARFLRERSILTSIDHPNVAKVLDLVADEALADVNRAIELNPADHGSFAIRGLTYQAMERYDEALADHSRAVELNPGDDAYAAKRAELHRLLGKGGTVLSEPLDLEPPSEG